MSDQISLLGEPAVTDPTPGRARRTNPATSKRAAVNIGVKAGALKHRILLHLADRGALGANDWELHVACDPKGRVHSAATRRGELEAVGMVRRTAITRPTGADLGDADLGDAYLSGANLSGANLGDAAANEFTRLPAGWSVVEGLIVPDKAMDTVGTTDG